MTSARITRQHSAATSTLLLALSALCFAAQTGSAAAEVKKRQVEIESRILEVNESFLKALSVSFEAGAVVGSNNFALSGSFGPTPPSQNQSTAQGMVGGDIRMPLFVNPFSITANGVAIGSPVVGLNARSFVGHGGSADFNIHPAPSTPTVLSVDRNWSVSPYVGVPILLNAMPSITSAGNVVMLVTPRIGPTFENVDTRLQIDEVGTHSSLSKNTTRTGVTGGIDFDVILRRPDSMVQPFFGISGEITSMASTTVDGRSPFPFSYLGQTDGGVNGAVKGRLGLLFMVQPHLIK